MKILLKDEKQLLSADEYFYETALRLNQLDKPYRIYQTEIYGYRPIEIKSMTDVGRRLTPPLTMTPKAFLSICRFTDSTVVLQTLTTMKDQLKQFGLRKPSKAELLMVIKNPYMANLVKMLNDTDFDKIGKWYADQLTIEIDRGFTDYLPKDTSKAVTYQPDQQAWIDKNGQIIVSMKLDQMAYRFGNDKTNEIETTTKNCFRIKEKLKNDDDEGIDDEGTGRPVKLFHLIEPSAAVEMLLPNHQPTKQEFFSYTDAMVDVDDDYNHKYDDPAADYSNSGIAFTESKFKKQPKMTTKPVTLTKDAVLKLLSKPLDLSSTIDILNYGLMTDDIEIMATMLRWLPNHFKVVNDNSGTAFEQLTDDDQAATDCYDYGLAKANNEQDYDGTDDGLDIHLSLLLKRLLNHYLTLITGKYIGFGVDTSRMTVKNCFKFIQRFGCGNWIELPPS